MLTCKLGLLTLLLVVFCEASLAVTREQETAEILQLLRKNEQEQEVEKIESVKQKFLNTSLSEDRKIINLGLGFHNIESNPSEAIKYLSDALSKQDPDDPLQLVIKYYLGQAFLKAGKYKEASQIAESLIAEKDVQDSFEKLSLTLAIESYYRIGDMKRVIELFGDYTKKFSFSRKQETLAQLTIKALEKKGDYAKSIELAEELARGYPTTPESRWAFHHLLELSCSDPGSGKKPGYFFSRKLLMHLAKNAIIGNGLEEFIAHVINLPTRQIDLSVRSMTRDEKADFLYRAKFYHAALKETRELYETEKAKKSSTMVGAYLFDLGRIHLRLFEPMIASMYFSKFIYDYPQSSSMHLVYENMADSLRYSNVPKVAGQFYKMAIEKKENHVLRWLSFWSLYRSKQYSQALELLENHGKSLFRQGDDPVTAKYWHGKILEKLGKNEEATKVFREILEQDGESFYANFLVANKPFLVKSAPLLVSKESVSSGKGMILAAKLMSGQEVSNEEIESFPDLGHNYKMIASLIKVGLKDVATVQLNSLNWGKINHEEAFAAISRLSYSLKDYLPSRKIRYYSFSPLKSIPTSWEGILMHQNRFHNEWKVYYPYAYHQFVAPISQRIKISPFLVLSVMRAESFYRKEARSGVGAEGLMQLMPYTAMKIATLLNDQDFNILHLDRPEVNIAYGAYYLDRLVRYYGGNYFLAVAAYNGGPHAVNHWLDSCRDCQVDEFIESISYRETRRYVREVMKNYFNYKRIYTGENYLLKIPEMPQILPDGEEIF